MNPTLLYSAPRPDYLPGEVIERDVLAVDGSPLGRWRFTIGPSPGSGYAGQVYRAAPEQPGPFPEQVAIKVMRPRSGWKNFAREALFGLGFQAAFAPRLREEAVQAGLLWQVILRAAVEEVFGSPEVVVRPYGYFWDPELASYAEVHAWAPGRQARFEPDASMLAGWFGQPHPPPATEMARKKRFMDAMAGLCRRLGALGLARQYDWYTLVSQANVLTVDRKAGEGGPAFVVVNTTDVAVEMTDAVVDTTYMVVDTTYVVVDCRPGLAVPFFLPVSPAHACQILDGLRRGVLVHYDEADFNRLAAYLADHPALADLRPLVDRLAAVDAAYRAGLPDLWHTRTRLLRDKGFRRRVCQAAAHDLEKAGLVSTDSGGRLARHPLACLGLGLLALLPAAGPWLVRLMAHPGYRCHLRALVTQPAYRRAALAAWRARDLPAWLSEERIPSARARLLETHPRIYTAEKLLLSGWPPLLHRLLVDPAARRQWLRARLLQPLSLLFSQPARCRWLEGILHYQTGRGVIPPEKARDLLRQLDEPRMQGFIRDLGFTAGLDIFSRLVYFILGLYGLSTGDFLPLGLAVLAPIPPSGPLRFLYVLARLLVDLPAILRHRDPYRGLGRLLLARLAALLIAPWRWIGNLFPLIEISAVYTRLAFVLAEYFAARAAGAVPIYGGSGKLLEYWVFQVFFNLPFSIHYEMKRRSDLS